MKWLLRKRHTLETGLLPLLRALTRLLRQKPGFWAPVNPRNPVFAVAAGCDAVFSQKNPVSDHPYFWAPVNPRNPVFAVAAGCHAFSQAKTRFLTTRKS
jgi:hypothetical protein